MSGKVDRVAAGFLDPRTGNIRSQSELKSLDSKSSSTRATPSGQTDIITDASNALGAVRSKINEQGNQIIGNINQQIDRVAEAQKLVKKQIDTAKELKSLIKEEAGSDLISAKKEELSQLKKESEALKQKIDQQNSELAPDRVSSIRYGNQTKGTYTISAVDYQSASDTSELDNSKEVGAYLDELKAQSDSLKEQKQELKNTRQDVRQTLKSAREDLGNIEDGVIASFDQASSLASKLSGSILSGGLAAVEAHSLNEISARLLLG